LVGPRHTVAAVKFRILLATPEDAPTLARMDAGAFGDAMAPARARIEPQRGGGKVKRRPP